MTWHKLFTSASSHSLDPSSLFLLLFSVSLPTTLVLPSLLPLPLPLRNLPQIIPSFILLPPKPSESPLLNLAVVLHSLPSGCHTSFLSLHSFFFSTLSFPFSSSSIYFALLFLFIFSHAPFRFSFISCPLCFIVLPPPFPLYSLTCPLLSFSIMSAVLCNLPFYSLHNPHSTVQTCGLPK